MNHKLYVKLYLFITVFYITFKTSLNLEDSYNGATSCPLFVYYIFN